VFLVRKARGGFYGLLRAKIGNFSIWSVAKHRRMSHLLHSVGRYKELGVQLEGHMDDMDTDHMDRTCYGLQT